MNRVGQRLLLAVLFWSLAMFVAPGMAFAYHDAIGVRPDETPFYTEGQKITTTLILSTGNVTFDHRYTNDNGETYYFVSFQDTSFEYGRSLPAYNQTLIVPLLTVGQHNYTRLLPAGTWTTTVEVRDGNALGEILFRQPVNVLVKGAEYNVIERQAVAEEQNVLWTQYGAIITALTALGAGLGGALLGARLSRKAAREQWQETKEEMAKDRTISEGSLKETQKSNEFLHTELEARLRPQLKFIKAQGSGTGQRLRLYSTILNAGQVPASNIVATMAVTPRDQLDDIVREKSEIFEHGQRTVIQTIQPNDSYEYIIDKIGTDSSYIVIWFEYNFLNKREEVIAWVHLQGGNDKLTTKWFTHDDIKGAEARLRGA